MNAFSNGTETDMHFYYYFEQCHDGIVSAMGRMITTHSYASQDPTATSTPHVLQVWSTSIKVRVVRT